jgi:hypothetical protein
MRKIHLKFNPETMQLNHLKEAAETLRLVLKGFDMVGDSEYHFDAIDLYNRILQHRESFILD